MFRVWEEMFVNVRVTLVPTTVFVVNVNVVVCVGGGENDLTPKCTRRRVGQFIGRVIPRLSRRRFRIVSYP